MILEIISLDLLKTPLREMEEIREQYFWSNDLLSHIHRKRIKYYKLQQYLLWCFTLLFIIFLTTTSMSQPEFICRSYWPWYIRFSYKVLFILFSICGYYIGIVAETYFTYLALNSNFQAKIIANYIKSEMKNYDHITLDKKLYSKSYQESVRKVLVKSIQQYQILKRLLMLKFF